MFRVFIAMVVMCMPAVGGATAGRVDSNGCHDSKRVGYHCHPVKPAKARANDRKVKVLERCRAGYLPKDSPECRMAVDAPLRK